MVDNSTILTIAGIACLTVLAVVDPDAQTRNLIIGAIIGVVGGHASGLAVGQAKALRAKL